MKRRITEYFIKGSNNVIGLRLFEEAVAIDPTWTSLDITFYALDDLALAASVFNIHRAALGAGITFDNGLLEIEPGKLTESLSALLVGDYRVLVKIKDATDTVGVYFGAADSDAKLFISVSDPHI